MSSSDIFTSEVLGTMVLVLLGGGVCAAVNLKRSKAFDAGWVAIAFGWGFAVLTGAYIAQPSGAHLNPAVTLGLAIKGDTAWSDVPVYMGSELLGALLGAVLVWIAYYGQFQVTLRDPEAIEMKNSNPGPVHGVFFTSPEVRNPLQNFLTEVIATFVLLLAILTQGLSDNGKGLSTLGALITALVVVGIGLSLGGPTGYAINPVRDLGPRIVHALLPLPNKGGSDWAYAWVPIVGPLAGGAAAAGVYNLAWG
ncbi:MULTISPECIES: MIP/aquaporin family protein [unclassified Streptomyces]|uniref:MIP/aquaporin family protein n=1 Tax=unclassified Streptomyces TaxID=2593676 RepID=UPI002DD80E3C|nr:MULTISPECIES: MIP/aquaporin family protein [unclassified Streptomyces]WSA96159.1 aquaporin family protein [Streptomyces sp. NBC_01795]WSB80572.1 aquaporin family protein [Streptomyces sp. NBC_01775]WSS11218.1 aquaporin family protein [Streptomyces sp. NBC_01186]WSS39928.1 aquaporin family protein [Streptomyces sp. NBC_01187]